MMEKPTVKDERLKNLMDQLFRQNAKSGNGSTAAAVCAERVPGVFVGRKDHFQKANNMISALTSWLKANPTPSKKVPQTDLSAAENVLKDMVNAVRGD